MFLQDPFWGEHVTLLGQALPCVMSDDWVGPSGPQRVSQPRQEGTRHLPCGPLNLLGYTFVPLFQFL